MYSIPTYINSPIGNNTFSYEERKKLWSTGKVYIPSLIQSTLADLQIGSEVCFEEVLDGKIISCIWLKNFVQLDYQGKQIFIVDNHNHALAFWHQYKTNKILSNLSDPSAFHPPILIHIDQHSDMKPNENTLAHNENIEYFINTKTNVGNFIPAAINSWIINDVIQIRSDYALRQLQALSFKHQAYILDIDIDFRADKEITEEEIKIIQKLILNAEIVTIATSPYFISQEKAIYTTKRLLWQV